MDAERQQLRTVNSKWVTVVITLYSSLTIF
jgi:hypothetical protein